MAGKGGGPESFPAPKKKEPKSVAVTSADPGTSFVRGPGGGNMSGQVQLTPAQGWQQFGQNGELKIGPSAYVGGTVNAGKAGNPAASTPYRADPYNVPLPGDRGGGGAAMPPGGKRTRIESLYDEKGAEFDKQTPLGEAAPGIVEGLQAPGNSQSVYETLKASGYAPFQDNAGSAYAAYMANRPDISKDPGLDPYYDEAERRATDKLNSDFAARGAYGSSVATGQIANAVAGLEAEKAGRESDYNLARLAEQRAWETTGLEGAASADRSGLANGQLQLGKDSLTTAAAGQSDQDNVRRLLAQSGIASQLGDEQLQRLLANFQTASMATNAGRTRTQDMFGNQLAPIQTLAPLLASMYGNGLNMDEALMSGANSTGVAGGANGVNQQNQQDQEGMAMLGLILSLYTGGMSGGAAGAAGGGDLASQSFMSPGTSISGY